MREPPRGTTPLLSVAWKVLAALSVFLLLVVGIGFLLPGTWEARRAATLEAPPDSVFPYLDVLDLWERWTPWPEVELVRSGPPRGAGATMSWDDSYMGDGVFRIVESRAPAEVRYRVEVEGGSIVIEGAFALDSTGGGTLVTWTERGDFGWNPLMGYAALTMDRVQGTELERGLARLRAVVETGALPDSLRPGAPPAG